MTKRLSSRIKWLSFSSVILPEYYMSKTKHYSEWLLYDDVIFNWPMKTLCRQSLFISLGPQSPKEKYVADHPRTGRKRRHEEVVHALAPIQQAPGSSKKHPTKHCHVCYPKWKDTRTKLYWLYWFTRPMFSWTFQNFL